jgi:hypothetical protein
MKIKVRNHNRKGKSQAFRKKLGFFDAYGLVASWEEAGLC